MTADKRIGARVRPLLDPSRGKRQSMQVDRQGQDLDDPDFRLPLDKRHLDVDEWLSQGFMFGSPQCFAAGTPDFIRSAAKKRSAPASQQNRPSSRRHKARQQITADLSTHQGGAKMWQYLRTSFKAPPRQASQQCLEAGNFPHWSSAATAPSSSEAPPRHVALGYYRARKSSRRPNLRNWWLNGVMYVTEGGAMPSPSCSV